MVVVKAVVMVDLSVLVFVHNNTLSKLPIVAEKDPDETFLLVFAS